MKKLFILLMMISALFGRNDIKSCYESLDMTAPKTEVGELFILIDQTTPIDKEMKTFIYANMTNALKNNNKISIATFSSNTNGNYAKVLFSGKADIPLTDTYDISKKVLRKYESCLDAQEKYTKNKATKALISAIKGIDKDIPKSDIFKSMNELSKSLITKSNSKYKTVLLVSNMMEFSTITSFYTQGTLKNIDTKTEMAKLKQSGYLANFNKANIYVMGAGLGPENSYRDLVILKSFKTFWEKYFEESNGNLVEFGLPMLLDNVKVK